MKLRVRFLSLPLHPHHIYLISLGLQVRAQNPRPRQSVRARRSQSSFAKATAQPIALKNVQVFSTLVHYNIFQRQIAHRQLALTRPSLWPLPSVPIRYFATAKGSDTSSGKVSLKDLLSKARQLAKQKNWGNLVSTLASAPDVLQNSELSALLIRAHAESGNVKPAQTGTPPLPPTIAAWIDPKVCLAFDDIVKHPKANYTSETYSSLAIAYSKDVAKLKDIYGRMKSRVNKAYHTIDSYRDFFHLFRSIGDKETASLVVDDLIKLGLVKDSVGAEELLPEGGAGNDKALLDVLIAAFKSGSAARTQTAASYAMSVAIRKQIQTNDLAQVHLHLEKAFCAILWAKMFVQRRRVCIIVQWQSS